MLKKWFVVCAVLFAFGTVSAEDQAAQSANIDIRSTLVGTRVYLGDTYVGDADIFLDDVPPGEHMIIMRQGSQRIAGQFTVKPGEMLMLEGRFEENRIVDLKVVAREDAAKRAAEERKAELVRKAELEHKADAERKKKEQHAKAEEKKKPEPKKTVVASAKPVKSPRDERHDSYLTLIRVEFEEQDGTSMKISSRSNSRSTTNFTDNKSTSGKLFRSKQNYTLCEGDGCSRDWTGRFFYVDETGKRDAFLIRWRETIFSGITLQGTSKKELDLCLNGDCKRVVYRPDAGVVQTPLERYLLIWAKDNFTVRRGDLLKEITDAGGKVPEF